MKKIILLIALSLLYRTGIADAECSGSGAAYSCSADSTVEQIQDAVDAVTEGGTVTIEAGSATWGTTLNLTKSVYLIGAGSGCPDNCDNATTITSNGEYETYLILIKPATISDNPIIQISGFTFNGNSISSKWGVGLENQTSTIYNKFRIYKNRFINWGNAAATTTSAIHLVGTLFGLIDQNKFENNAIDVRLLGNNYTSWDMWSKETGTDRLELSTLGAGGADLLFIESNISSGVIIREITSGQGARFAYRYNTSTNHNSTYHAWVDIHGDTNNAGVILAEVYENTKSTVTSQNFRAFYVRGGTSFIFRNVISGYTTGEHWLQAYWSGAAYSPVKECGYTMGTNNYDMAISNSYFWGNKYSNDNFITLHRNGPILGVANDSLNCITPGSDYWSDIKDSTRGTAQDQYDFASGAIASRPASPDSGDVFWATDEIGTNGGTGVLYRAKSAGVWTQVYTPYTYPHPLRGESTPTLTIPQGVHIGGGIRIE